MQLCIFPAFSLVSIITRACETDIVLNTLGPGQSGSHLSVDILIFLNKNLWLSITISWQFVPSGPINNILALVQIMAWRSPGNKPLFKPMILVCWRTYVTRPQWLKCVFYRFIHGGELYIIVSSNAICKIPAILFRPCCINGSVHSRSQNHPLIGVGYCKLNWIKWNVTCRAELDNLAWFDRVLF